MALSYQRKQLDQHSTQLCSGQPAQILRKSAAAGFFSLVADDISRILEVASDRLTPPRFRHALATKNIDHTVIAFMAGIFILRVIIVAYVGKANSPGCRVSLRIIDS